jgi:hypothetical protein
LPVIAALTGSSANSDISHGTISGARWRNRASFA